MAIQMAQVTAEVAAPAEAKVEAAEAGHLAPAPGRSGVSGRHKHPYTTMLHSKTFRGLIKKPSEDGVYFLFLD
jgi:hypothetical protein